MLRLSNRVMRFIVANKLLSCLILCIVLFAALPYSVVATNGSNFFQRTSSGNLLGTGHELQINQDIQGDLVLVGSSLEINGNVAHDFIGAGGELTVNGNISGSIIAVGGSIKVNGNVDRDVIAIGSKILLSRNSIVNGDILLGGGNITLNGIVNGNGEVSADTLSTGDNFKLKGNLELEATNYPSNLNDNVSGNLNATARNEAKKQHTTVFREFSFFWFIIKFIASLAIGFILINLFPHFVSRLTEIIRDSALKAGLLGLLILIFLPILAIILLFTIVGWSLSVLMILLMALGLLIATVPVKLIAGEIIYNKMIKKEAGEMVYFFIGAVLFAIAYEIPFLGTLIYLIALFIGLGVTVFWLSEHSRSGI